jgi:hypothetical protein
MQFVPKNNRINIFHVLCAISAMRETACKTKNNFYSGNPQQNAIKQISQKSQIFHKKPKKPQLIAIFNPGIKDCD